MGRSGIAYNPLKPAVSHLRPSLQQVIKDKSPDSQQTEKFSSQGETNSNSTESSSSKYTITEELDGGNDPGGMCFPMMANLARTQKCDFFSNRCTSSISRGDGT